MESSAEGSPLKNAQVCEGLDTDSIWIRSCNFVAFLVSLFFPDSQNHYFDFPLRRVVQVRGLDCGTFLLRLSRAFSISAVPWANFVFEKSMFHWRSTPYSKQSSTTYVVGTHAQGLGQDTHQVIQWAHRVREIWEEYHKRPLSLFFAALWCASGFSRVVSTQRRHG